LAAEPERTGPLAGLPSKPGAHIAKIQALGDKTWLNLGTPARDPKWGMARGRSWGAAMPFAPDLRGAFLFGEGPHGMVKPDGHYMDDLWFYDLNAHRWICLYPGIHTKGPPELVINEDGFEATKDGRPLPIASMVHGYQMITYDTDRRRFMNVPCPGAYWKHMKKVAAFRKAGGRSRRVSPFFYDTVKGRWDGHATKARMPRTGFGDLLMYIPSIRKTIHYRRGQNVYFFDAETKDWSSVKPKGARPRFGIDFTACYDSERDRVWLGGGSYPVVKAPEQALLFYDIKTRSWGNPKPEGGRLRSFNTNTSVMNYDAANDVVVVFRHDHLRGKPSPERGVNVYDPQANAWNEAPLPLAEGMPGGACWNGFYDPGLNAHAFHLAGDGRDGGSIWVYRYKRAPEAQ
jgi:hypothetical protein